MTVQEDELMPAILHGRQTFLWDFAKGPFIADILLKLCNRGSVPAAVCCEAGSNAAVLMSASDGNNDGTAISVALCRHCRSGEQ